MALADQVYGFFIPTVNLLGVGASKEVGNQIKGLGATKDERVRQLRTRFEAVRRRYGL